MIDGIEMMRVLKKAKRERVFAAWTKPDLMARWFFPGMQWTAKIDSDLRTGGKWSVEMREPSGTLHHQFGEYREVVPVSRLVFTWSCPDLGVVDSVVTVELSDHESGTELRLRHQLPPDPKIRAGHEEGWNGCLGNLEQFLEDQT